MKPYISILLTVMLVAYLIAALTLSSTSATDMKCTGLSLHVQGDTEHPFVTADELMRELDSLPVRAKGMPLSDINPDRLRKRLLMIDKIEDVEVVTFTDGKIEVNVTPIIPVARVFDDGKSYYINRSGKRVTANARYHTDVPIIRGHFVDSVSSPVKLLPLVDKITSDSVWSRFFTMIDVKPDGDVILVPNIREHVVNIGNPTDLDDKFSRLRRFYTQVLSKRGYESYDTLSVKWKGQVVATRRKKMSAPAVALNIDDDEAVDTAAMLAGNDSVYVAPGQTIPGVSAHNDRPIPAKKTNS